MFNFFVDNTAISGDKCYISGADFNHIKNVLRLKESDQVLISHDGISSLCELLSFSENTVLFKIVVENYQDTALPIEIYLFQGLPKADKFELIIQKAVELGAHKIVPVQMKRSIVKIEDKKKKDKVNRWQAISESSAKQSKRTSIPEICPIIDFKDAVTKAKDFDLVLIPYENKLGMSETLSALKQIKSGMKVAVFIGPEGGFDESEIELAKENGAKIISLGKRILRTETASIATLSMLMLYAEINL